MQIRSSTIVAEAKQKTAIISTFNVAPTINLQCHDSHIIKYLPKNERVGSPPGASLGFKLEWLHVLGRIVRERDARVMRFLVAAGDYSRLVLMVRKNGSGPFNYPVGFFGPSESLTEARDLRLRNFEMKEGNFSGVEEESRSHEYGAAARHQPLSTA
ncbi:unnamed protein product [Brassica rapa subsp. narinosa]